MPIFDKETFIRNSHFINMRLSLLFLFSLLLLSRTAFSGNITINGSNISFTTASDDVVGEEQVWRFSPGDNLQWAQINFDDSKWDSIRFPITTEEMNGHRYNGNVWFRAKVFFDTLHFSKNLSFIISQFGASEIYIDGKLIQQFGKIGHSSKDEENFNPQGAPISFVLDSAGFHTIAIRYSNHQITNAVSPEAELDCFSFQIAKTEDAIYLHKVRTFYSNIIGATCAGLFITLSLINFILFLFYKREKTNLYYSLFSLTTAGTFIIKAVSNLYSTARAEVVLEELNTACVYISFLFLVALVYSFVYEKFPKRFWVILAITVVGLGLLLNHYDASYVVMNVFNIYCVIDITITVLISYFKRTDPTKRKRKILKIVFASMGILAAVGYFIHPLISIIIFGIFVALFVIPVAGMVFIVPIYMTVRHAKSFAVTNKNLEDQLIHVQELSAKTIEQELEKKKILETQNERLEILVTERTAELAQKNSEIKDSINYAQRIQNAILTTKEEINQGLKNCFVLFKPKDIVSGDFYFYTKKENTVLIAAADCTGHGVPGALMSMIGTEKLMSAALGSSNPSTLLNLVNKGIKSSLKQSDHEESTRDGMDIALVSMDLTSNKATYSGANRPIWIIRNGSKEIEEIKATKKAIGGFTPLDQHFDLHDIQLNSGDTFYLFTDGYADQFGYTGKKLMTKKFKDLLLEIQHLSMPEQEKHLDTFIENWKQGVEQIDDILVIGVRV